MGAVSNPEVIIRSHIREPILLEGNAYTLDGLLAYCREQVRDPDMPSWKHEVYAFMARFLDPAATIIQKSSGSTGDPKSFKLSREAMIKSAERTIRFFRLHKGDRILLSLPIHYIAGKMMLVRALVGGLDLILAAPSSRPLQENYGTIRLAALVPLQIEESLHHGDSFGQISQLLIGGGELHPVTRQRLSLLPRPEVYESFGMTETYTHFALKRINGPKPDQHFKILEGVRIGRDPRGCLEVEVPGVTAGPLLTSDLVEFNTHKDGFSWLGRFDNLINTGGIKIIPELLEEEVRRAIGHECLVLHEPDRKLGNRLVLVVEYEGDEAPRDQWLDLLRSRLTPYELPRRIITVQALPRNASMKPDRTRARKLLL